MRLAASWFPAKKRALGAVFDVVIESFEGHALFTGKGKVVAKQEHRLGVRLSDVDKVVLARLQAEVARLIHSDDKTILAVEPGP